MTKEIVLGQKEQEGKRTEGALTAKIYVRPSNAHSMQAIKTVDDDEDSRAISSARQHNHVKVELVDNSITFITSDQTTDKTKIEPHVVTPVPTEGNITSDTRREPHRKVLVLSSVGRSGSSFLGLLLAALGNNMYFFEPIRGLSPKNQNKESVVEEVINYFHCKIRKNIFNIGPKVDISIIHPYTRNKTRKQVTVEGVEKHCRQEPLIVMKTIRLRLKWVREVMRQKELENLKVIHLVRDPRGSFTSMERLKWNVTNVGVCDKIYQDLQERETMMSLYPGRYTFIKYENLCRDPYGETKRLLRFLSDHGEEEPEQGNKNGLITNPPVYKDENRTRLDPAVSRDLPKGIIDFLDEHLHFQPGKPIGAYTTVRDTKSMYQRWRWYITGEQLKTLESLCGHVIRALGHRMFSTFADVRNSSLSLFDDKDIT